MEKQLLSDNIMSLADSVGIDVVGFAEASEFTNYALNHHQRRDPKLTLPNAKSIIIAGIYIGGVTLPVWENAWYGRTSRLYLSGFFLDVVKPLAPIVEFLRQKGYQTRICDGSLKEGSILPLKLATNVKKPVPWRPSINHMFWMLKGVCHINYRLTICPKKLAQLWRIE